MTPPATRYHREAGDYDVLYPTCTPSVGPFARKLAAITINKFCWAPNLGIAAAGAVMTGSHCDAIPLAGLYDGTLGVLGAAAAVKALRQAGYVPAKTIEVIMFTSEEPTRFGLGCIGR